MLIFSDDKFYAEMQKSYTREIIALTACGVFAILCDLLLAIV